MKSVIVIPHIPKTGGQSLRNHFSKYLLEEEFIHLGGKEYQLIGKSGLPECEQRLMDFKSKIRACIGHHITKQKIEKAFYGTKKIIYACCFRDPVERWISEFNFKKNRKTTTKKNLEEYFNQFGKIEKNYQVYWMWHHFLCQSENPNHVGIEKIFSIVLNELKKFHVVGRLEYFESYQRKICKSIGIPECRRHDNQRGVHYPEVEVGTLETRAQIRHETTWDQRLLSELNLINAN